MPIHHLLELRFFRIVLMCFHEKILSLLIAINEKYFPENSSLRKVHYTTFCLHFVFVMNVFRKMLQIIGIFYSGTQKLYFCLHNNSTR